MNLSELNCLPPRLAAVVAAQIFHSHQYAMDRLYGCIDPSPAAQAIFAAYEQKDQRRFILAFDDLADELRAEKAA